jgi:CDP-diacylglycerol--glycerol-3-phosphate 3-phosphatidyltransferase
LLSGSGRAGLTIRKVGFACRQARRRADFDVGIWLSSQDSLLTLVGSSNYGYRSAVRDLEVNLAIQTTSPELKQALSKELMHIREHATDRVNDALFQRSERKVGIINRFAAR